MEFERAEDRLNRIEGKLKQDVDGAFIRASRFRGKLKLCDEYNVDKCGDCLMKKCLCCSICGNDPCVCELKQEIEDLNIECPEFKYICQNENCFKESMTKVDKCETCGAVTRAKGIPKIINGKEETAMEISRRFMRFSQQKLKKGNLEAQLNKKIKQKMLVLEPEIFPKAPEMSDLSNSIRSKLTSMKEVNETVEKLNLMQDKLGQLSKRILAVKEMRAQNKRDLIREHETETHCSKETLELVEKIKTMPQPICEVESVKLSKLESVIEIEKLKMKEQIFTTETETEVLQLPEELEIALRHETRGYEPWLFTITSRELQLSTLEDLNREIKKVMEKEVKFEDYDSTRYYFGKTSFVEVPADPPTAIEIRADELVSIFMMYMYKRPYKCTCQTKKCLVEFRCPPELFFCKRCYGFYKVDLQDIDEFGKNIVDFPALMSRFVSNHYFYNDRNVEIQNPQLYREGENPTFIRRFLQIRHCREAARWQYPVSYEFEEHNRPANLPLSVYRRDYEACPSCCIMTNSQPVCNKSNCDVETCKQIFCRLCKGTLCNSYEHTERCANVCKQASACPGWKIHNPYNKKIKITKDRPDTLGNHFVSKVRVTMQTLEDVMKSEKLTKENIREKRIHVCEVLGICHMLNIEVNQKLSARDFIFQGLQKISGYIASQNLCLEKMKDPLESITSTISTFESKQLFTTLPMYLVQLPIIYDKLGIRLEKNILLVSKMKQIDENMSALVVLEQTARESIKEHLDFDNPLNSKIDEHCAMLINELENGTVGKPVVTCSLCNLGRDLIGKESHLNIPVLKCCTKSYCLICLLSRCLDMIITTAKRKARNLMIGGQYTSQCMCCGGFKKLLGIALVCIQPEPIKRQMLLMYQLSNNLPLTYSLSTKGFLPTSSRDFFISLTPFTSFVRYFIINAEPLITRTQKLYLEMLIELARGTPKYLDYKSLAVQTGSMGELEVIDLKMLNPVMNKYWKFHDQIRNYSEHWQRSIEADPGWVQKFKEGSVSITLTDQLYRGFHEVCVLPMAEEYKLKIPYLLISLLFSIGPSESLNQKKLMLEGSASKEIVLKLLKQILKTYPNRHILPPLNPIQIYKDSIKVSEFDLINSLPVLAMPRVFIVDQIPKQEVLDKEYPRLELKLSRTFNCYIS